MSVTDGLQADVVERLRRDLRATLGDDHAALVRVEAANARTFADEPGWYVEKVVGDVQQRMHDEFVDTAWPRCPRHGRHPLWYREGAWRCEQDGLAVAGLGELGASARGPGW